MPSRPKRPCRVMGCRATVDPTIGFCDDHQEQREVYEANRRERRRKGGRTAQNRRRYNDGTQEKFYWSPEWKRMRSNFLMHNPICASPGCQSPSAVVDHVTPISEGGDPRGELQGMCKYHHDLKRQSESVRARKRNQRGNNGQTRNDYKFRRIRHDDKSE